MTDIETQADIDFFLERFYARIRQDPELGPIFDEVARVDWPTHLPKIGRFWSDLLLGTHTYEGHPMRPHLLLAQQTPIRPDHFERWLGHFSQTLSENFLGQRTQEALLRAKSIAAVMQSKLHRMELLASDNRQ
jgi:hemoglobin